MPSKENFVFPSPLRSAFTTFVLSKTPKTMSEEYVDLFDSDDRPLSRSVPKRQAHQQGLWHRSAHVWIYDRTGNILMQKRAQTKDTFPGLWDISVAGHISAGEPPTEGALRELKEEIGLGKTVHSAIKTGFAKALSAIVDGNVTTLIAAAVLYWRGSGTVKGFATTLALGIVLSMFTALVISRLLVNAFYAVGLRDEKFYGKQKERKTIDFLEKRKVFFTISIILILLAPIGMGVFHAKDGKALNYSLEFMGGTSTNVTFNEDLSIDDLDSQVKPVVQEVTGDANIQISKVADSNAVIIKTRSLTLDERQELNQKLVDSFGVDESKITAESISSTVSSEMRRDAIVAVLIATICMLLYIWFRFKDVRFASSAVLALLHDVLVVLAFYALSRISVGNTFIACMLTIVGYSINATIVIFDRIRENLKTAGKKADLKELVNLSITQTLTRSIYTSFTTFITIFVVFVMGVSSIREFALPIMVGIVCGAYSSVCITGALWYVLKTKVGKRAK